VSRRELDRLARRDEGCATAFIRRDSDVYTQHASRYAKVVGASLDYLIDGVGEPPTDEELEGAVKAAREALQEQQERERRKKKRAAA